MRFLPHRARIGGLIDYWSRQGHMEMYFDLDGTLIDVSRRHYTVYSTIAERLNFRPLSYDYYWSLKRAPTPLPQLLKQSRAVDHLDAFRAMWLRLIEQDQYLDSDVLFAFTVEVLKSLRAEHTLILVTLRHSQRGLERQLNRLKLVPIFNKIISAPAIGGHAEFKTSLISKHQKAGGGWIVGDTEADVMAGKALGFTSCAVASGLRCAEFLRTLKPDYIIDSIAHLPSVGQFAAIPSSGR